MSNPEAVRETYFHLCMFQILIFLLYIPFSCLATASEEKRHTNELLHQTKRNKKERQKNIGGHAGKSDAARLSLKKAIELCQQNMEVLVLMKDTKKEVCYWGRPGPMITNLEQD